MPITAKRHVGLDDRERGLEAHLRERGELAADRGHVGRRRAGRAPRCGAARAASTAGAPRIVRGAPSSTTTRGTSSTRAFAREGVGVAQRIEQRRRSATTADDSERDAHASAIEAVAHERIARRARRRARGAPRPPGRAACARCAASAERSMAAARSAVSRNVRPAGHAGSVAYPEECPASVSLPRSSTSSSAISTATSTRMLDAYERADAAGCDLVAFPELALTGYPPEDLLLRPSFVARLRRGARQARGPHRSHRGGGRLPRGAPRPRQRGRGLRARSRAGRVPQAPAPELRGVRRAALLRAVHRRRPAVRRRPACGSRSRSAKTRGARTARSSRRPRAAPSSW